MYVCMYVRTYVCMHIYVRAGVLCTCTCTLHRFEILVLVLESPGT